MSYVQKAVRGTGIVFLLSVLSSLVAYITKIVLARELGPADYGLFSAVLTLVMFFLFFRDLGLRQALVKYIAEFNVGKQVGKIKSAIGVVFLLQVVSSVILAGILFFVADYLALSYFADARAALALKVLVVYVFLSVLFLTVKAVFQGYQRMFAWGSVELMKNLFVLVISVALLRYGFMAPIYAYALVGAFLFLVFGASAYKSFPYFKHKSKDFAGVSKKVWAFGVPVFMTAIGGKFIAYIDTLLLTSMATIAEVGIYNVVLPTAIMILLVGRVFGSVVFPMVSELWAKKDLKRLEKGIDMAHKYVFILAVPVISILYMYADWFILTFFGGAYLDGVGAFRILLIGVLFYCVAMVNNNIISGMGRPKTVTVIVAVAALVNVILNLLLIKDFGIVGAAMATTISYLIVFSLSTHAILSQMNKKFPVSLWFRQFVAATALIASFVIVKSAFSAASWISIGVSFISGGALYLLLLFALRVIRFSEIKRYWRKMF